MKRLLAVTLGVVTAIGGFVDIGELVANSEAGARFGLALAWPILLGVLVMVLYAEMAGRIATISGRPVFDLVRERLGPRLGLAALAGSVALNLLTLAAELAGVALAIELITSVAYLLWIPVVAFGLWLLLWRVRFESIEHVLGIAGLALFAFTVAVVAHGAHWGDLLHQAARPSVPSGEGHPTYFYWAIAVFGGTVMPYELLFFSSGAVEEGWTPKDLVVNRANVYLGFPLGAVVALSIMAAAALVLRPAGISVHHLDQSALPVALGVGRLGLGLALLGFLAATLGASFETALANSYAVSQYFGWPWGKRVRPREAPLFHVTLLATILVGAAIVLTTIDPVTVTEYAIVFSAVALPLTYFPVLLVANDAAYVEGKRNRHLTNLLATVLLVVVVVASVAAIPLMVATKGGS